MAARVILLNEKLVPDVDRRRVNPPTCTLQKPKPFFHTLRIRVFMVLDRIRTKRFKMMESTGRVRSVVLIIKTTLRRQIKREGRYQEKGSACKH